MNAVGNLDFEHCGCPQYNGTNYNGPSYEGAAPTIKNGVCCLDNGYGYDTGLEKYVVNAAACG